MVRTLLTIHDCGSKIARNSVYDCNLLPAGGQQMAIKNSVSNDFLSTFVESINVFKYLLSSARTQTCKFFNLSNLIPSSLCSPLTSDWTDCCLAIDDCFDGDWLIPLTWLANDELLSDRWLDVWERALCVDWLESYGSIPAPWESWRLRGPSETEINSHYNLILQLHPYI